MSDRPPFDPRRAWWLALLLALAACGNSDTSMTMAPTLHCAEAWRCNVIGWTIGFWQGPKLAGLHGGCRCVDRA